MAVPHISAAPPPTLKFNTTLLKFPISASFPIPNTISSSTSRIFCRAANSRTGPVKNKNKKKKRKKTSDDSLPKDFQVLNDFPLHTHTDVDIDIDIDTSDSSLRYPSMPLPEPPVGFLLDDNGNVLHASPNRLATVVDPANNLPLECVIRRVFKSSDREECMLLCPVDTPVQILKSSEADGWSAISDEEVESILPAAAYALAKIHMHLVYSGYCYTARGGFCYTEEDIFDFHTDDGKRVDGLPTEGVEITSFDLKNYGHEDLPCCNV